MCLAASCFASGDDAESTHWGNRKSVSYKNLKSGFADPDMIYAPFTFWFWDEPIKAGKAANMARKMLEQGLNPGYPHARMSQAGTPDLPRSQWLSDQWMNEIDGSLKEAQLAGGYLGYVDEYWWPSGRAAGRVLKNNPELWSVSLKWQTFDVDGQTRIELPESFFSVAAKLIKVVEREPSKQQEFEFAPHRPAVINADSLKIIGKGKPFTWNAPKGSKWRIYSFTKYFHPGADGGRLNYLDERASDAFIELAHEPYEKRFANQMGKSMPGVFVDNEGDYGYKLAWSDNLDRLYKRKWDTDIRLTLPLMFDKDIQGQWGKVRWQWFEVVSDIYSEYLGGVSRWLEDRNMYCISNLWEETLMWQAGAVGDFFKAQRAYSMPGTDCLGLNILKVHDFKETQSITEFEGRRFQSEIMGAAGWWQFKPFNIKQAANAATAWGISHVVPHAIYMTRKFDRHPWLPDWFDENPMWPYMHLWTDFVRRTSYINSHGHSAADVLMLSPMDSVWALCGDGVFDPAIKGRVPGPAVLPLQTDADIDQTREQLKHNSAWWCPPRMDDWFSDKVRNINRTYSDAMAELTAHRIEYLIADRHYMRQMKVKSKELVRGEFKFATIVLPPMVILPLDVAKKVAAFAKAGGQVYALGELPNGSVENGMNDPKMKKLMKELVSYRTVKICSKGLQRELQSNSPGLLSKVRFAEGPFDMLQQHRRIDGKDFFWLANNEHDRQQCTLVFHSIRGAVSIWDCETGHVEPIRSQDIKSGSRVSLTFEPYQGYWLVFDKETKPYTDFPDETEPTLLAQVEGKWQVNVDMSIQPPLEHPVDVPAELKRKKGDLRTLAQWQDWGMKGFSGYVDYRSSFDLKSTDGRIVINLHKVQHMAQVWVNGVDCGMRLWKPFEFDITDAVKEGKNKLHIRVGNLVNDSYNQPNESGLFGPVEIFFVKR